MARLRIVRPGHNFGEWRKLWVYIDDKRMGYVSYDSHSDFEVAKGKVRVYVKMSWYRSAEVQVDTNASPMTEIHCISPDSYPGGKKNDARAWMFIFDSIFNHDKFFKLEVVESATNEPKLLN